VTVTSYFLPSSLAQAIGLLESHGPSLMVMAGGTVAMPLVNEGISLPEKVMGLRRAGLDGLTEVDGGLRIGATVTLTRLLGQTTIPMLSEAARCTASWSIRNMGTVGGNLFTPPPGGDVAVALLALDAELTLTGPAGERAVPLSAFYTGFMTNVLRDDELLTAIRVPAVHGETSYVKFGRKQASTPAVVTVGVRVTRDGGTVRGARIALGAAGPHPMLARDAERAIVGSTLGDAALDEAAAAAERECEAFSDGVASEWYRRRMVRLFVRRALERLREPELRQRLEPGIGEGQ
jgi:CO/xanthine dehydrogenase FAD-binding subunit